MLLSVLFLSENSEFSYSLLMNVTVTESETNFLSNFFIDVM